MTASSTAAAPTRAGIAGGCSPRAPPRLWQLDHDRRVTRRPVVGRRQQGADHAADQPDNERGEHRRDRDHEVPRARDPAHGDDLVAEREERPGDAEGERQLPLP